MKIINVALCFFVICICATVQAGCSTKNAMSNCNGINSAKTARKVVALTFDDGPHPVYTREILEILKLNNIRATFFVIGKNVEKYPEVVKYAYLNGNIIANHTYSHCYLTKLTDDEIKEELTKSNKLIHKIINKSPILFRPPYGACSVESAQILPEMGFTTITWNDMTNDYNVNKSAKKIANDILSLARPGAIIGLHDGGGNRKKTVEALLLIIYYLKKDGYEFLTIPELLNIDAYATDRVLINEQVKLNLRHNYYE